MKRLNFIQVIVLNAYWVGLSFMWNSLHVIILPAVLLYMVPEQHKNTYLGLLTFFGLVIAMIVQPISGAASDRWRSSWGRRRPLILIGTSFDFIFLAILAWSGGLVWLIIGYLGLQFSSNVAHGPMQGLLPDKTPPEQLGWASGFKNLMDMLGLIVSSLLVGRLLTPEVRHPVSVVGLIAGVLAVGACVTLLGVREDPSLLENKETSQSSWFGAFQVDLRAHAAFAWLVLSRLFYLIGVYGVQTFAQYYIRDVVDVANPIQLTGDLLATVTVALVIFTLAGGWLGDRFGHKKLLLVSCLIGALGNFLLLWGRTPGTLLAFGSVFGIGIGLFMTANWALANKLAPPEQAGKFMGLTNLATAGAAALGRLEGPLLDVLNNAWPGEWWGYSFLFIFGAICILVSAGLLRKIHA